MLAITKRLPGSFTALLLCSSVRLCNKMNNTKYSNIKKIINKYYT